MVAMTLGLLPITAGADPGPQAVLTAPATVAPGDDINVALYVTEVSQYVGLQAVVTYDPESFEYKSVAQPTSEGLLVSVDDTTTPGTLYVVRNGLSPMSEYFPFTLIFTAKDNIGAATFTASGVQVVPVSRGEAISAADATTSVIVGAPHDITVGAITNGSLTVASSAAAGSVVTVVVSASNGYRLKQDTLIVTTEGGGTLTATKDSETYYSFTMPDENVTLTAEFELFSRLVVNDMTNGTVTISGENGEIGAAGQTVTLTIEPDDGYRVKSGSFDVHSGSYSYADSVTSVSALVYTFTVPNGSEPIYIDAEFEEITPTFYDVIFSGDAPIKATVGGADTTIARDISPGGSVSFTLEAMSGYEIIGATVGDTATLTKSGANYTLSNISQTTVVFVETREVWQPADRTIYTAEELEAFRAEVDAGDNFKNKIIRLGADIDLTGREWRRIGEDNTPFSGTFDGDGYTITIDNEGLFKNAFAAVVKNLRIDGKLTQRLDQVQVGAVFAMVAYGSAFINCTNNADMIDAGVSIGIANSCYVRDGVDSLPESYVGIYRCTNNGDVVRLPGGAMTHDDNLPHGTSAGIGINAQRIILCVNNGTIIGGNNSSQMVYGLGATSGTNSFIDRCVNNGDISINLPYPAAMSSNIISNSYNTGDITFMGPGGGDVEKQIVAFKGGYNGILINNYDTGNKSAPNGVDSGKHGFNFDSFYIPAPHAKYGSSQRIVNCYNVPTEITVANLGAAFVEGGAGGLPVLAVAAPKSYSVTFSSPVTIGGVTGSDFTLPGRTYTYTSGAASGKFNLLADGRTITLSATVTFDLPDDAEVTVNGQTANQNGTYTLDNGTYSYLVTQNGKAPLSGTFDVTGVDRTIKIGELPDAVDVTFDAGAGVAIELKDANGFEVLPVSGTTYKLAEGAEYIYSASKSGYVGIQNSFTVVDSSEPIAISLSVANATVTFNTTPSNATVVVKDSSGATVLTTGGNVYQLTSGEAYTYTASATNYIAEATTDFTASNGLAIPVALVQNKYDVTFSLSPASATLVVKSGNTVVQPSSGKTYKLDAGAVYSYTATAGNYVDASGTVTADATKTVSVVLAHKKADVKIIVSPADATVAIHSGSTTSNESYTDKTGSTYTYSLDVSTTYEYSVLASGHTTQTDLITVAETNTPISIELKPISTSQSGGTDTVKSISAGQTITEGGTYLITKGSTGYIYVKTTAPVTITGTGISSSDRFTELEIQCDPGTDLTISNLYIYNSAGGTGSGETGAGKHIINFTGGSNSLKIAELSLFDQDGYVQSSAIHVPSRSSLTMSALGSLYMYKRSQGAGIGGDSYEASGAFTFTGGYLYIKGSKTGALIGGDAGAAGQRKEGSLATNETITFSGGKVVLIAKAQGAAIGASHLGTCAGEVIINGAKVTVISDFNAGVGRGGDNEGAAVGTLQIISGTFTAIRTANSYYALHDNPDREGNRVSSAAYLDDTLITSPIYNAGGERVHLFTYDTSKLTSGARTYPIAKYTESSSSTMANFSDDFTNKVYYEFLTEGEHIVTFGTEKFTVTWNEKTKKFDVSPYEEKPTPPKDPAGGGSATEAVIPELAGSTTIEAPAATVTTSASGAVTEITKVETVEVAKSVEEAVKIVEAAKADGKADAVAEVKIVVKTEEPKAGETPAHVTTAEVELIVEAVKTIAKAHDVVLTIESEVATITLDSATLEGIAEGKADGDVVIISATTLEAPKAETGEQADVPKEAKETLNEAQKEAVGENTVIDLTVTVGGKAVHDFKGEVTVASPYTPPETTVEEDYDLLTVYYVDDNGNIQEIKGAYFDPKTKQIVFKTTHFSKFMVAEWINPFSDIAKGEWYYKSVRYGVSNDLLGGIDGKFLPRTNSSRATMIVLLAKLAGIDIDGGANWYDKAIEWGVTAKITDGTNPTGNITREQLFQLLYNYSGAEAVEADFSKYTDADLIHDWALPGMNWAIATGLATGRTATTLNATEPITRSEVVTFLQKFLTMAK
jgi:hypothetical protein